MLYGIGLSSTVLYCRVLPCIVLYRLDLSDIVYGIVLFRVMLVVLYYHVLCCVVLDCLILVCIVLDCCILPCLSLHDIVLYCLVRS